MKKLIVGHLKPLRQVEHIIKIVSLFLEVEDLTQKMGPLYIIMHLMSWLNIHLAKIFHAAKDHIEKTESVCPVLEEPIKLIQVIIHAPYVLPDTKILKLEQISQSFASYARADSIIAIGGHRIVMNAHITYAER